MNIFTQAVSMYCNKEQYEADLRKPLLDMGYEEICVTLWEICPVITNNGGDRLGEVTNIFHSTAEKYNRYFIDHYNPKLFLALAAMRKTTLSPGGRHFSVGKGEWIKNADFSIQQANALDGFRAIELWEKMTKEEIIKKFTMKEDLRELLTEGRAVVDNYGNVGMVVENPIKVIVWCNEVTSISKLNENLGIIGATTWEISKIHEIDNKEEFFRIINGGLIKLGKLVWQRKKQYTVDQLIEKAGLKKDEVEIIQKTEVKK